MRKLVWDVELETMIENKSHLLAAGTAKWPVCRAHFHCYGIIKSFITVYPCNSPNQKLPICKPLTFILLCITEVGVLAVEFCLKTTWLELRSTKPTSELGLWHSVLNKSLAHLINKTTWSYLWGRVSLAARASRLSHGNSGFIFRLVPLSKALYHACFICG